MGGSATIDQLFEQGLVVFDGDRAPLDLLRGALVQFAPNFELLPGTR